MAVFACLVSFPLFDSSILPPPSPRLSLSPSRNPRSIPGSETRSTERPTEQGAFNGKRPLFLSLTIRLFPQLQKGDLLLSVDDVSLCGLTHTQAVATLKATISRSQVTLGIMDGPETSYGASNFIPSWMFWQKLPRSLQYPKVILGIFSGIPCCILCTPNS